MRLNELNDDQEDQPGDLPPQLAVVYGGRFQPPHPGHLRVYNWLSERFGRKNVFIAMSDRVNTDQSKGDISPFPFNERKHFWLGLFPEGPRGDHIIKCKNPAFKPTEIFEKFPNNKVIYVAATSQKDAEERYKRSKFFEPYPMAGDQPDVSEKTLEGLKPAQDGAYYVIVPTFLGGLSATQVRTALLKDEPEALELYHKVYGANADEDLFKKIRAGLEKMSSTEGNNE